MAPEHADAFVNALIQAQDAPSTLFQLLPEDIIWAEAGRILTDQDLVYNAGVTLVQAISEGLDRIVDIGGAIRALALALRPFTYSLIYHYAQAAVLAYADHWDSGTADRFFDLFKTGYRQNYVDGNQHVAVLALHGLTMLGILRYDMRLHNKALGLLLSDFPAIPEEPDVPAPLACAALHMLGRCYDFQPEQPAIPSTIEGYVKGSNREVVAEALYNLGLVRLHDAFRAPDANALRAKLLEARELFFETTHAEENRSDARLLLEVINCYLAFMSGQQPSFVVHAATGAREVFIERVLYMESVESSAKATLEWSLVQLLNWLAAWSHQMEDATAWPDIVPPMNILAGVYSGVRDLQSTRGIVGAAAHAAHEHALLPDIRLRFQCVQSMGRKLEKLLAEPMWRQSVSPGEVHFYEMALQQLQSSCPKDDAAASLAPLIAAAQQSNPVLCERIKSLVNAGESVNEIVRVLLGTLILDSTTAVDPLFAEIFERLVGDLRQRLQWAEQSPKWVSLLGAVGTILKYAVWTSRTGPRLEDAESLRFLYAGDSAVHGLGEDATERDLEVNFQKWVTLNEFGMRLDRQPEGRVPGRPDLVLTTDLGFDFPVEVKREFDDISPEHIRSAMLSQSQIYASEAHQIAFQLVLDLRDKSPGTGFKPINIADRCYLDTVTANTSSYADFVIVVIIEGNRHMPHEYSSYSVKPRTRRGHKKSEC